jgi:hypothetical protein
MIMAVPTIFAIRNIHFRSSHTFLRADHIYTYELDALYK